MRTRNRFQQAVGFRFGLGIIMACGGVYAYGTYGSYGSKKAGLNFPMEVVEPSVTSLPGMVMPESLSRGKVGSGEEDLVERRMEAQRALRDKRALQLAKHRRKSAKAWRKEIEIFLANQRKIRAITATTTPLRLKATPALRPKAGPDALPSPKNGPSKRSPAKVPSILA